MRMDKESPPISADLTQANAVIALLWRDNYELRAARRAARVVVSVMGGIIAVLLFFLLW